MGGGIIHRSLMMGQNRQISVAIQKNMFPEQYVASCISQLNKFNSSRSKYIDMKTHCVDRHPAMSVGTGQCGHVNTLQHRAYYIHQHTRGSLAPANVPKVLIRWYGFSIVNQTGKLPSISLGFTENIRPTPELLTRNVNLK